MSAMIRRRIFPAAVLALWAAACFAAAAKEPRQRSVQGIVTDAEENPIARAVVQLKNTRTLQVKSFLTDEKGGYRFHGLDPDLDYELKAEYNKVSSPTRKVTSFDSRKDVVINFKLDIKK